MIEAQDANELARELYLVSARSPGERGCYLVCLSSMTAVKQKSKGEIPFLTGHGSSSELGTLIHSFHQWGQPIRVGLIVTDGLFQFWLEKDED